MICHGCKSVLSDKNFLKCNSCKSEYCFECLNLTKDCCEALNPDQIKALSCPYCQNVTRRVNNDDTPCRQRYQKGLIQSLNESMNISFGDATQDVSTNISSMSQTQPCTNLANVPVTMESISKLFDLKLAPDSSIMTNLRSALNKDIEKMVVTHVNRAVENLKSDFTSTTDYLAAEQADLRSDIRDKDTIIKQLQSDMSKTQTSLVKLQSRIQTMEKISRDLNLEIHEVPENKNENLMGLFKKLCECLKVDISDSDVRACRRVAKMDPSTDRPRNIIVSLSSQRLRDHILSSVTRFNKSHPKDKLASTHIGLKGETRRIYVAEHLSPEAKEVHSAARKFCRDKKYKFVWVRFGQVYIRKDEQSPAHLIKTIDHLNKFS
ncbi:uncharacterized protein LOC132902174 [Amyelois transitella]|uniref:uncharacterized protein LOC132902174 n=1 Tax=Amyelois transitella TaxID=680683 RepID=UPI002990120F|nr:uncharacterized protein LOC132902174 [Amyelois transitella]